MDYCKWIVTDKRPKGWKWKRTYPLNVFFNFLCLKLHLGNNLKERGRKKEISMKWQRRKCSGYFFKSDATLSAGFSNKAFCFMPPSHLFLSLLPTFFLLIPISNALLCICISWLTNVTLICKASLIPCMLTALGKITWKMKGALEH